MHSLACLWAPTYSVQVSLRVVLVSGVHIVVDGRERGAAAATVLGLEAEDGDSVLGGLELLGQHVPDFRPLDAGRPGVDQINSLHKYASLVSERTSSDTRTCQIDEEGNGYLRTASCPGGGSRSPFECKEQSFRLPFLFILNNKKSVCSSDIVCLFVLSLIHI